jgi:hypothetical protein
MGVLKKIAGMAAVALLSPVLAAQPAIYQNQTLTIPQGAALGDGDPVYFENIQLVFDAQGFFTIADAEERPLVSVSEVSISIMESFPVQVSVNVSGNKSIPCVELLTPAVAATEGGFTVTLAESVLGPADETCIAVLDPFETTVSLPVEGLDAGTYTVSVNGVKTEFTLESDNP